MYNAIKTLSETDVAAKAISGWMDGWKSLGGVKYRAAYAANKLFAPKVLFA